MKILASEPLDGGRMPSYFDGLAALEGRIARPDVEVRFAGMPQGVHGAHRPADSVIYPYFMSLHIQHILDNALRAEAEGYDVFAIGSVQNPGLEEARSVLDIPVVGNGKAAMHFACLPGRRFVVLAFRDGFDQVGRAQSEPGQLFERFRGVPDRPCARALRRSSPGSSISGSRRAGRHPPRGRCARRLRLGRDDEDCRRQGRSEAAGHRRHPSRLYPSAPAARPH